MTDHTTPRETLRGARQTLGLTYEAFAAALGIHKSTLSRYESGQTAMPWTVELAVRGLLASPKGWFDAKQYLDIDVLTAAGQRIG